MAIAAGVVESVLAVAQIVAHGRLAGGDWADIGLRTVVYALATLLVVQFSRGRGWARLALTVLLTVIGLGTLVIPAVAALADGQTLVEALSDGGKLGWAFITVRLLHIACVLTASVAMYLPSANHFFAYARRAAVPAR